MRFTKLVAVLSIVALAFVACGGGDDDGGGGGSDGGSDGGGGGSIDGGALDASTCAQVIAAMASAYSGTSAAMTGGDAGDMQSSIDALENFAANAPDEIADDMQTLAAAYAQVTQALADSGYDPASGVAPTAEQAAALQQATAGLNSEEFQQASDNLTAWFQEQCGG
jgi:hypothetical protein